MEFDPIEAFLKIMVKFWKVTQVEFVSSDWFYMLLFYI